MEEEKEDCPLCSVSEETIKNLEKAGGNKKENSEKQKSKTKTKQRSSWLFKIIFLIIVVVVGSLIFYQIFEQSLPEFVAKKSERILSALSKDLEVGDLAPDFISEDVFGNEVALSDFRDDKPVLLVFWATWCGYCAKELPALKSFVKDHQDEIKVIAITSGEDKQTIKEYVQEKDVNFTVLLDLDRKIWNQYPVRGTPAHFLIDSQGNIVALRPGLASKEDLEILMTMLTELW
jgi:peroxiredoxin